MSLFNNVELCPGWWIVGNFIRQAWVTLAVFPFAKVNLVLEGMMEHSIPCVGASFMKASNACREPIGFVQPRPRMAYVGSFLMPTMRTVHWV